MSDLLALARRRLVPTEHDEQVRLMEWAALAERRHPELALLCAVPNGGYRSRRTAGRMKAEGLRAGYPDLLLDVARGPYHGLRIELKRADGGRVAPSQAWWHDRLRAQGYRVDVCNGWEVMSDALVDYLSLGEYRP